MADLKDMKQKGERFEIHLQAPGEGGDSGLGSGGGWGGVEGGPGWACGVAVGGG